MELYAWGFNAHGQLHLSNIDSLESPSYGEDILIPQKIVSATEIHLVWASWSDAIIILDRKLHHTGFHPPYASEGFCWDLDKIFQHVEGSPQQTSSESYTQHLARIKNLRCFGTHDGLQGCIVDDILFVSTTAHPNLVIKPSQQETHPRSITALAIAENGRVAVCISQTSTSNPAPNIQSYAAEFEKPDHFKTWCMSNPTFNSAHDEAYNVPKEARPHLYHSIKSCGPGDLHVVANATTFTLLTPDGAVYTYGDPRYPRCLGRPPNHNSSNPSGFEEIEYLSHTPCRKIASAGWMTGALSNDGELFIWGQSEPGVDKAIAALNPSSANGEEEEDEADEFVKVVKVTVDGADATVTDFGIGTGHLVVVARVEEDGEVVKRAVLACGQGESGQLGIGGRPEFVGNLMEIEALRDMDVTGVMCGGRSSFLAVNLMR